MSDKLEFDTECTKKSTFPLRGRWLIKFTLKNFLHNEFDETDEVLYDVRSALHEESKGFAQLQWYLKSSPHTSSVSFLCSHFHFKESLLHPSEHKTRQLPLKGKLRSILDKY